MLNRLVGKLDGAKSYILSAVSIVVAFIGVYWGPIDLMPGETELMIPQLTWEQFWMVVWTGSAVFTGRSALKKLEKK